MCDEERKRIERVSQLIKESADIERNVISILNACYDGMTRAANDINADAVKPLSYQKQPQLPFYVPSRVALF